MANTTDKSLAKFYEKLSSNPVRTTNMFEMELYPPGGISDAGLIKGITYYGQSFSLPSRTLNFADVSFKGSPVPVPTNMTWENEHTITINADVNGNLRRTFLQWQALTCNPNVNYFFEGDRTIRPDLGKIRIKLLGIDMKTYIEIYTMHGVRVMSVGALNVSNTDANVATFDVQFKSLYWSIEEASGEFADSVMLR